jgi:hypothetical protein
MMPRTTLNLDGPVLRDLKRLQRREKKPLGRLVSDLLAKALGEAETDARPPVVLSWTSIDMNAKVDLTDKEAVYAALESNPPSPSGKRKPKR